MENDLEHDIRNLAYHIWLAAGGGFGQTALDFWVMAEQMVIEFTADSARRAQETTTIALEHAAAWPSALRSLYLYRIRELAHNMWIASADQRELSLDYWLAAERHLRLMTDSATRTISATSPNLAQSETLTEIFETFSPANYLEQIRKTAYQLWDQAGRQYGSNLEFWLAAEKHMLDSLTGRIAPHTSTPKAATAPSEPSTEAPTAKKHG